jgi:pimeloyl-ACP methyl ester carboxylesterase
MTEHAADGILLIHGAHHGAWAWNDVLPLLDLPCLAVSLPGRDGAAPARRALGALTLDDLIGSAASDLEGAGWNRAVIVGHSLGGAVAAGLAARVPQRTHHLVLIAASVPAPGTCALDGWPAGLRWLPRAALALRPGGSGAPLIMSARRARGGLANDLDQAQTRRLLDLLVPEAPGFLTSPLPGLVLPPSLPRSYLVARRDRINKPRRQAATAVRLGATVIEVDSGHDPMLSQPAAVAAVINWAAAKATDGRPEPTGPTHRAGPSSTPAENSPA